MARAGKHDDLQPTNFTASVLKQFFINPHFEAFTPDLTVESELRLDRWGVAGRVFQMPGHTPGSLVVELDDGRTFVGDMVLGGYLGGAIRPTRAGEHYFHADRQRNLQNIRTLLQSTAREFHLGHGGPVSRESVLTAFGDLPAP
jgi:glyoxylase-like metal-dependent hydrolase (beta-lactamase superfamily II)